MLVSLNSNCTRVLHHSLERLLTHALWFPVTQLQHREGGQDWGWESQLGIHSASIIPPQTSCLSPSYSEQSSSPLPEAPGVYTILLICCCHLGDQDSTAFQLESCCWVSSSDAVTSARRGGGGGQSDQDPNPKGSTGQGYDPDTGQEVRVGWSLLWERRNVSSVTASPLSHCPLGTSGLSPPSHRKPSPSWRQKEGTLKEGLQGQRETQPCPWGHRGGA